MDQKRILWIVAASGIFLLVVVGVAMFLSAPQIQTQQTLASLQGTGNTWIKGEVKNPEINVPKDNTLFIYSSVNTTLEAQFGINPIKLEINGLNILLVINIFDILICDFFCICNLFKCFKN